MALQLRRGTNAQRLGMTPANGELIFVTDYALVTTSVTSINTGTETLSTTLAHGLSVNQQVKYIGPTLNGLTANQVYYVKTAPTITDFTLSTSLGGGTLNISGTFTIDLVFAKTPTLASGAPVGTGVSALWVGDGVTVGGLIAANLNLDDLLDVEITSLAEGNTLYYDATTGFWKNTNIVTVDDVNSRVGINNPTPTQTLDVSGNGQFSGAIYGNNTDQATTAYTGSIQTLGGIGVVKNAFIGGAIYGNNTDNATTAFTGGIQTLGGIGVAKAVYAGGKITTVDSTQSTTPSTGALIVGGGAGIGGNLSVGGAAYVNNTDQATTTSTGSIQTLGGIGVTKNAFIGGSAYVNNTNNATTAFTGSLQTLGGIGVAKDIFSAGKITTTDGTQSTTPSTGALIVGGGAGIGGNLSVGGAIYGNSTANATTTTTGSIQTLGGIGVVKDIYVGGAGFITSTGYIGGTTTLNNGTVLTNSGNVFLFDTVATTVDAFGAATSINIGAATGTTTINNSAVITGDLTVNGTTTTINTQTVLVEDKNIEMGVVATPTDITADGGGIILKGTSDKTILYDNSLTRWVSNIGFNATGALIGNVSIADGANDNTITTSTGDLDITATGNNGVNITSGSDGPTLISRTSTPTNTNIRSLGLNSQTSGTPATGIGNSIEFNVETAVGVTTTGGYLSVTSTDITPGAEDFKMSVGLMNNGATYTEVAQFSSVGDLQIDGDLTVSGNDIKSSSATALTLSGADVTVAGNLAINGTTLTLDADNAGAGNDITIIANRGSSGTDATAAWLESTGFWTFSNKLYGIDEVVGGTSIGTNGNNIYFNNEDAGTGATSNLTVKRGTQPDVTLRWFESPISSVYDRWQTTTDGTNYINIPDQNLDVASDVEFQSVTIDSRTDIDTVSFYTTATTQTPLAQSTRNVMKCLVHISQGTFVHCVEALVLGTSSTTAMLTTYGEMYDSTPLATFAADTSGGTIRLLVTPANTTSMLFSTVITSLT